MKQVTLAQVYGDREQVGRRGVSLESSGVRFSRGRARFIMYPRRLSGMSARLTPIFHDPLRIDLSPCQLSAKLFGKFRKYGQKNFEIYRQLEMNRHL